MSETSTEDKTEVVDLESLLTCLRKHGVTKFARQGFIVEFGPAATTEATPAATGPLAPPSYMRGFSK